MTCILPRSRFLAGVFFLFHFRLKDDKIRFTNNLEVQLLLKQGQVEVDGGPFIHDYRDSLLLHRSAVEDLNAKIRVRSLLTLVLYSHQTSRCMWRDKLKLSFLIANARLEEKKEKVWATVYSWMVIGTQIIIKQLLLLGASTSYVIFWKLPEKALLRPAWKDQTKPEQNFRHLQASSLLARVFTCHLVFYCSNLEMAKSIAWWKARTSGRVLSSWNGALNIDLFKISSH